MLDSKLNIIYDFNLCPYLIYIHRANLAIIIIILFVTTLKIKIQFLRP